MAEANQEVTFNVDKDEVAGTLEQLMAVDATEIEENYGPEKLPEGTYHFRVKQAELDTREMAKDKKKHPGVMVDRAVFALAYEVINVHTLKDATLDPADYIGSEHYESFAIFDLERDVGRLKGLMKMAGYVPPSNMIKDMLMGFVGHEFVAVIKYRKDKSDPTNFYANIDVKACSPLATGQAAPQPQPAAPAQAAPAQTEAAPTAAAGKFAFGGAA